MKIIEKVDVVKLTPAPLPEEIKKPPKLPARASLHIVPPKSEEGKAAEEKWWSSSYANAPEVLKGMIVPKERRVSREEMKEIPKLIIETPGGEECPNFKKCPNSIEFEHRRWNCPCRGQCARDSRPAAGEVAETHWAPLSESSFVFGTEPFIANRITRIARCSERRPSLYEEGSHCASSLTIRFV